LQLLHGSEFGDAVRAPICPKIDEQGIAPEIGEMELAPVLKFYIQFGDSGGARDQLLGCTFHGGRTSRLWKTEGYGEKKSGSDDYASRRIRLAHCSFLRFTGLIDV
jgi:hypothetical protein